MYGLDMDHCSQRVGCVKRNRNSIIGDLEVDDFVMIWLMGDMAYDIA